MRHNRGLAVRHLMPMSALGALLEETPSASQAAAFSSRCISSGVASPAASASVHPLLAASDAHPGLQFSVLQAEAGEPPAGASDLAAAAPVVVAVQDHRDANNEADECQGEDDGGVTHLQ